MRALAEVLVGVALSASTSVATAGDGLAISDILTGLKNRESVVAGATVHLQIERLGRVGIKLSDPLAATKFVMDCTWDRSGRVRYDLVGQWAIKGRGDPFTVVDYNESLAFDGSTTRNFRGQGKERKTETGSVTGEIFNGRQVGWPLDPREFDTSWYDEPVSKYLGEGKSSVIGTEEFDGHKVLLCEVEYREEDGFKPERKRLWIDPYRGFIVVKKEGFAKPSGKNEWVLYGSIESTDHIEVIPGIWLPRRGRREHYIGYLEGERRLWRKADVQFSEWKVNEPLPNNFFNLEFVPNIHVVDSIRGKTYRTQDISEAHLDAQVARTQQLAMEFQDMRSDREIEARLTPASGGGGVLGGVVLWAGAIVLAGGVACIGYYLWRSKRQAA